MFCPNCGTQNDSAATPCKKCGFKLSGISAPKFKGTMMLNSEHTVQDLIDQHRRKQEEGMVQRSTGNAGAPGSGSSAPPHPPSSVGSAPRSPVLQPPRAGASRRRMGGTMLGVAPQAGGVTPPAEPPPPVQPMPEGPGARHSEPAAAAGRQAVTPVPGTDPLAGTFAMPAAPAPEAAPPASEPRTDDELPLDETPPFPSGRARVLPTLTGPAPVDATTASLSAEREGQAPQRRVAATAPLPQMPEPAPAGDPHPASLAPPPRVHPLDVVLIICTFGLYGLVLWARQRKRRT